MGTIMMQVMCNNISKPNALIPKTNPGDTGNAKFLDHPWTPCGHADD